MKHTKMCETHPQLLKEWNYEGNEGLDPYKIGTYSHKEVEWICNLGHKYKKVVAKRTGRGEGCYYCSGKRIIKGETDFATMFPDLALEWDYQKNDSKPEDFHPYSHKRVFWKCPVGHSYNALISDKTAKKIGCKYCCGKVIKGVSDLATRFPDVAKEWDYQKNGSFKPSDYSAYSNVKVHWICKECGKGYRMSINAKVRGRMCNHKPDE